MNGITRFERLVLLPLDAVFGVLALNYGVSSQWFGVIVALSVVLLIVSIGRSIHGNKTDALSARRDDPVRKEVDVPGTFTETESILLTKGLAYSATVLTAAVVVLTVYSGVENWWVVALMGLGTAGLYLFLAKVVVQILPMISARGWKG